MKKTFLTKKIIFVAIVHHSLFSPLIAAEEAPETTSMTITVEENDTPAIARDILTNAEIIFFLSGQEKLTPFKKVSYDENMFSTKLTYYSERFAEITDEKFGLARHLTKNELRDYANNTISLYSNIETSSAVIKEKHDRYDAYIQKLIAEKSDIIQQSLHLLLFSNDLARISPRKRAPKGFSLVDYVILMRIIFLEKTGVLEFLPEKYRHKFEAMKEDLEERQEEAEISSLSFGKKPSGLVKKILAGVGAGVGSLAILAGIAVISNPQLRRQIFGR